MVTIDELTARLTTVRSDLDRKIGEANAVLTRGKALEEEISSLKQAVADLGKVASLFTTIGEERQEAARRTIEDLVTQGLQTIFDDTLSFHIVSSVRGKSTVVDFMIRTTLAGSVVDTPVMDSRGGGLAATVGFLLRVVVLMLKSRDADDKILVLDETFSMVSAEYLPGVAAFLRDIVDRFGVQIIMVTHQELLTEDADVVYRFSQTDGRTKVARV